MGVCVCVRGRSCMRVCVKQNCSVLQFAVYAFKTVEAASFFLLISHSKHIHLRATTYYNVQVTISISCDRKFIVY